jgi:hypothetical protein
MTPRATPHGGESIVVSVPLTLRKRGGRKEVVLPEAFASETPIRPDHQKALVIAIARTHRWQKLLDDGKFESISDLARQIGLDVSFAARLLRLTLLAPDIVEAILMGEEPSGLSLTMLTKEHMIIWSEQRTVFGLV